MPPFIFSLYIKNLAQTRDQTSDVSRAMFMYSVSSVIRTGTRHNCRSLRYPIQVVDILYMLTVYQMSNTCNNRGTCHFASNIFCFAKWSEGRSNTSSMMMMAVGKAKLEQDINMR